jgi:hypothetical protein
VLCQPPCNCQVRAGDLVATDGAGTSLSSDDNLFGVQSKKLIGAPARTATIAQAIMAAAAAMLLMISASSVLLRSRCHVVGGWRFHSMAGVSHVSTNTLRTAPWFTQEETPEERGRRIAAQWTHDPESANPTTTVSLFWCSFPNTGVLSMSCSAMVHRLCFWIVCA